MKKLFTFVASLLLTLCAVGVSAQTACTLGGQSKNGQYSYGWNQEFGPKIDLFFSNQWGEFNLATNLTGAVGYRLTVAEANEKVTLRIYGANEAENAYISINGTEISGSLTELSFTPTKIGVQASEAGVKLGIVSFVLIDGENNEVQTDYSVNWGVIMLGGKYTSSTEWAELMVNGVEDLGKQRLTIKFNAATPSVTIEEVTNSGTHLKIIKDDDSEEYPVIPAGVTSFFYDIDAPVKQVSIQARVADVTVDIASVTTQPFDDLTLALQPGDIYTAVQEASANIPFVRNMLLVLNPGEYTISNSITVNGSLILSGGSSVTIDASQLQGPMITNSSEQPGFWPIASIGIVGLTIKGLSTPLFYSATKNYFYDIFTLSNCVVEIAGDVTTFDFTKGSVARLFSIESSTFYAPTATTKSFYSSQNGQKATEYSESAKQTFSFSESTFYNLVPTKNFFSHRQNSQKWLIYDVKDNIFVNCGKSGQVIAGMNGGGKSSNPVWTITGNVFNFNGEDTSAQESTGDEAEPVSNSVAGVITFTDPTAPDFGGEFATSNTEAVVGGDPRWTITVVKSTALETSDLRTLIGQAEELVRMAGDNPDANAQTLASALNTAKGILETATTQDDIDQATNDLQQAINNYNTATGIQTVDVAAAEANSWYTLQGVSVAQPAKGLYIKNGKKVLVK